MIVGVMMVRNEADIIHTNLAYHLDAGVDEILVVDNGSIDGTTSVLREYAASGRVHVSFRPGRFLQAATTTELAREAFRRGARWVLPIDADEFWYAPGGRLRDVLDDAAGVGALQVDVRNFVQHRAQDELAPRALLGLTHRVREPLGTSAEAAELVESGRVAFVECRYPPKHLSRATVALDIAQGNHAVAGLDGPVRPTTAVVCLHAPLRARVALTHQKVEQGRRIEEVNHYLQQAWHVRRWKRLADEGRIDAEWCANSHLDGCLDVAGERHPLVIDNTLRDLVAPFVDSAPTVPLTASRAAAVAVTAASGRSGAGLDETAVRTILDRMDQVEGWLRREEGELLLRTVCRAVERHAEPAIVEVGSYCGRSTVVLGSAARLFGQGARVYAIDPHEGEVTDPDTHSGVRTERPTFDRFRSNIEAAGVDAVVEVIRQRSFDVPWQAPIALLFVDGLHDYVNVARDMHHFEPYLCDGAFVVFHDCDDQHPGVKMFVAGIIGEGTYEEVDCVASLMVLQRRVPEASAGDRGVDSPIAALRARLGQQERGIAFLMEEIAGRERTIRQRDEGIEWLESVVRDKELAMLELQKGIDWLRDEVRRRDALIETIRANGTDGPERPGPSIVSAPGTS
jgi:hypothetical protein